MLNDWDKVKEYSESKHRLYVAKVSELNPQGFITLETLLNNHDALALRGRVREVEAEFGRRHANGEPSISYPHFQVEAIKKQIINLIIKIT